MGKLLKYFFAKPSTVAYAGLWAMAPKFLLTIIVILIAGFSIRQETLLLSIMALAYPMIGLTIDIFLYVFRDRIWKNLSNTAFIPENWQITTEQLQQYAKNLPKARFTRFLTIFILMPFFLKEWVAEEMLKAFVIAFVFSILFDRCWLKFFKIQAPKFSNNRQTNNLWDRSGQDISKQMDATIPGSTAWFSMQNINSIGARTDPWK